MLLRVDHSDSSPLYLQIAAAIRAAIAHGDLAPGDRLPSGRDLAETSGVTLETVQRAYRRLTDDGIVVARVGRGTSVAPNLDVASLSINTELEQLITAAKRRGLGLSELQRLIGVSWSRSQGSGARGVDGADQAGGGAR